MPEVLNATPLLYFLAQRPRLTAWAEPLSYRSLRRSKPSTALCAQRFSSEPVDWTDSIVAAKVNVRPNSAGFPILENAAVRKSDLRVNSLREIQGTPATRALLAPSAGSERELRRGTQSSNAWANLPPELFGISGRSEWPSVAAPHPRPFSPKGRRGFRSLRSPPANQLQPMLAPQL